MLTIAASKLPEFTHANMTPQASPLRFGAVSTTYAMAPGNSPPIHAPCKKRNAMNAILAVTPMDS